MHIRLCVTKLSILPLGYRLQHRSSSTNPYFHFVTENLRVAETLIVRGSRLKYLLSCQLFWQKCEC